MKKMIALLCIAALVISLASCAETAGTGSTDSAGKQDPAISGLAGSDTDKGTTSQDLPDGYYNVGDFTVFVPEGWTAIPVPDLNDPSKILTNDIQLAKNAVFDQEANVWNTDDGTSFFITLLPQEDLDRAPEGKEHYAKDFAVSDMEDLTIGALTWHGYLVKPIGAPVYMMWAAKTDGAGGYYTSISTAYGMSLEDADIQAILGSLK